MGFELQGAPTAPALGVLVVWVMVGKQKKCQLGFFFSRHGTGGVSPCPQLPESFSRAQLPGHPKSRNLQFYEIDSPSSISSSPICASLISLCERRRCRAPSRKLDLPNQSFFLRGGISGILQFTDMTRVVECPTSHRLLPLRLSLLFQTRW